MELHQLDEDFTGWDALLALIQTSFADTEGRIDPPSSAKALTAQSLRQKAGAEIGFIAMQEKILAGCIFCRLEPDCLYIGKLAVLPTLQGRGIGRGLIEAAEQLARQEKLPALRLETRIELVENHATFAAWGFRKTAENAHPGFDRTTSIEMRKSLLPAD
ncbi:GNAT family N-acetyltransferase [Rhizobium tumorigenes]|uniref:GNAT family N-acetyltransferase n=1 Tax=Rhizobium tumorigenes TaxID=2041385 RepID=UPI0024204D3D|nr:GNAT family N-acetyltransferase [Rhizobium tumorigenes]WFS02886.1 GNAT family N-acetyltransferase [Rhizobium tumorigenes]